MLNFKTRTDKLDDGTYWEKALFLLAVLLNDWSNNENLPDHLLNLLFVVGSLKMLALFILIKYNKQNNYDY